MSNWYNMTERGDKSAEIVIYDEIGGFEVNAKDFRRDLKALGDLDAISLRINSPGGSVIDGFAIYNALIEHPAHITARIDGWAASMASIIAMAADVVEIPENAWFMIHNPWTMAMGDSADLRQMADILERMQGHAIKAYLRHTDLPKERVQELMDAETWMDGVEAVAMGFADVLLESVQIAASVKRNKLNAPEGAKEWLMKETVMVEVIDAPAEGDELEEVVDVVDADAEDPEERAEVPVAEESDCDDAEGSDEDEPGEEDKDAEINAAWDEGFFAGVNESQAEIKLELEGVRAELALAEAKVETLEAELARERESKARLLNGMAPDCGEDAGFTTWEDAKAALGYEKARSAHPGLFDEYMRSAPKNRPF